MYGGAAGGGKSDALLMAALQYVHVPTYAALLLRRTFSDLAQPGALIQRAHEWLGETAARWLEPKHTWYFPSGATLTFGHIEHENDKYNYQGSQVQFVGFDELTQFSETQYRYLFSRMRRLRGASVPVRMRSASNPGGAGHDWVRQRFLAEGRSRDRWFVPARLEDNPHLDRDAYVSSLQELDPYTRAQLLAGDWDAKPPGSKFRREWFTVADQAPTDARRVRYWDLAATEAKPGHDPDWTAGVRMATKDGRFWIEDVRRLRGTPGEVEAAVAQCAALDGPSVAIWIEQEPGSGGVNTIDNYRRKVLVGENVHANRTTGNKELRMNPLSSAAQAGNVLIVPGAWVTDFLDEIQSVPSGSHDDQADAASGAHWALAHGPDLPFAWLRRDPAFVKSALMTDAERILARRGLA